MPDYSKGQIYMLECDGLIYVGSTVQELKERKQGHTDDYTAWLNGKGKYLTSYKLLEKNKPVNIILLLEYPCNSKRELEELEQHYIDEIDCVNKQRCFSSEERKKEIIKQYRQTSKNVEYRKKYDKEYKLHNKESIDEYQKKYRQTDEYKEYQKQYRESKKVKNIN